MRGVSNVVAAAVLIAIAATVAAVVYPWSLGMVADIEMSATELRESASRYMNATLFIYYPTLTGTSDTNAHFFIHNYGTEPVVDANVFILVEGNVYYPRVWKVGVDGNVYAEINDLLPGEVIVGVFPPEVNDYRGYTLLVRGKGVLFSFYLR